MDTPINGHCYHEYYESFFSSKKNQQIDFLEIGAFKGNAAAAFFFYFKKANIISCDLLPDLFLLVLVMIVVMVVVLVLVVF